jgi:hypothetical protein
LVQRGIKGGGGDTRREAVGNMREKQGMMAGGAKSAISAGLRTSDRREFGKGRLENITRRTDRDERDV